MDFGFGLGLFGLKLALFELFLAFFEGLFFKHGRKHWMKLGSFLKKYIFSRAGAGIQIPKGERSCDGREADEVGDGGRPSFPHSKEVDGWSGVGNGRSWIDNITLMKNENGTVPF